MSMDRSAVKAIVDTNIETYMAAFGIPHWSVTVLYGPAGDNVGSWTTAASVEYQAEYERATITVNPEEMEDEAYVLKCLRHELFHILAWAYGLYRKAAWCPSIESGSADDHREEEMWKTAQEQFVKQMERLWHGFCQYKVKESNNGPA